MSQVLEIVRWNTDRGFGFIRINGQDYFLHVTAIEPRQPRGVDLRGQKIEIHKIVVDDRGPKITSATLWSEVKSARARDFSLSHHEWWPFSEVIQADIVDQDPTSWDVRASTVFEREYEALKKRADGFVCFGLTTDLSFAHTRECFDGGRRPPELCDFVERLARHVEIFEKHGALIFKAAQLAEEIGPAVINRGVSISRDLDLGVSEEKLLQRAVAEPAERRERTEKLARLREKYSWLLEEDPSDSEMLRRVINHFSILARPDEVVPYCDIYGRQGWSCWKKLPFPVKDAWENDVEVDSVMIPISLVIVDASQGIVVGFHNEDERQELLQKEMTFLVPQNQEEYEEVLWLLQVVGVYDVNDFRNTPVLMALYPVND
ncbi:MAG: hypothetical protein Q8N16_00430 [bacterium]|nr:hypothetical protein [bacterium]